MWENRRHFIRHTQISGRVPKIAPPSRSIHLMCLPLRWCILWVIHAYHRLTVGLQCKNFVFWIKSQSNQLRIIKKFWNSGVYVIFWRLYPVYKNFLEIDLYILTTTCASICSVLHWIPIFLFRFNIGSPQHSAVMTHACQHAEDAFCFVISLFNTNYSVNDIN